MNTETRIIRPFAINGGFQSALANSQVRVGQYECEADGRITLEDGNDLAKSEIEIRWSPNTGIDHFAESLIAAARQAEIDLPNLTLLVTAYTGYLRISSVMFERSLDQLTDLPPETLIDQNGFQNPFGAVHHGATVTISIVLNSQLPESPLKPSRIGTWLAKSTFTLAVHSTATLFAPVPLDDEMRDRLRIPRSSLRYVDIGDHDPLRPYDDTDAPEYYVDSDLLERLNRTDRSRSSRSVQRQLVLDFISAIVWECSRRLNGPDYAGMTVSNESLAYRIMELADSRTMDDERVVAHLGVVRSNPSRFLALVENALEMKRAYSTLLAVEI